MPQLGTKKFWKSFNTAGEKENQILKNSGYINIQLVSVSYMSKGNFFQNVFGGTDRIALSTSITYGAGPQAIEATSIQDVSKVKVNNNYILGIQRVVAEKIPANANSLSISIKMTAVKNDLLQAKFDMLNKPEYQGALKLAPPVVGQVLTITSLVKGLFSDSDPQLQLEASFAGTISQDADDHPVNSGKLTQGLLMMISTDEGNTFDGADASQFELKDYTLHYKNKPVENTYVVLRISFELNKGEDQQSNWSLKYSNALSNLDKLQLTFDQAEKDKIKRDSMNLWIEGNALLDADLTYINLEKLKIKATALKAINDTFNADITPNLQSSLLPLADIIQNLTGTGAKTTFGSLTKALPSTGTLIMNSFDLKVKDNEMIKIKVEPLEGVDDLSFIESLNIDTKSYLKSIGKYTSGFKF